MTVPPGTEVVRGHKVFVDGKWEDRPGDLDVGLGGKHPDDVDEEVERIFGEAAARASVAGNSALVEAIHVCKHKVYAISHHAKTVEAEVRARQEEFIERPPVMGGVSWEEEVPAMTFEIEALLFQTKSLFDVLTLTMRTAVPSLKSHGSFASSGQRGTPSYRAGGAVLKDLEKTRPDLAQIFEAHLQRWGSKAIVYRDIITHTANLKKARSFVVDRPRGGPTVDVTYPTLPNGMRADVYAKMLRGAALTMAEECLVALTPPKKGPD